MGYTKKGMHKSKAQRAGEQGCDEAVTDLKQDIKQIFVLYGSIFVLYGCLHLYSVYPFYLQHNHRPQGSGACVLRLHHTTGQGPRTHEIGLPWAPGEGGVEQMKC